jgi:hypothetical protein
VAPSLVADTDARLPRNEPIGVRTALTITTSYSETFEKKTILNFTSTLKKMCEFTLRLRPVVDADRC